MDRLRLVALTSILTLVAYYLSTLVISDVGEKLRIHYDKTRMEGTVTFEALNG